jgi:DinB family protein
MATDIDWNSRCADHQREIALFLADAERLDDAAWTRKPAPGKWSPGQIAEHLVLSYAALRRELAGGAGLRLRTRFWRRQLIRWRFLPMILKAGRLPPGAPAVREIRPADEPRSRAVVTGDLREQAACFEQELGRAREAGGGHVTHPFLGRFTALEAIRFVAVHAAHHHRQIPGAAGLPEEGVPPDLDEERRRRSG